MADDDTPRNADFIERVVGDPKSPPETRMLTGWLGDAADEGYRRLYTDAELCAYVDVPSDAILYTESIRDVQPSGGVFVWIKRDAALKPGGSASSRAARFLQGQVQQDYASGGGAAAGGGGGQDLGSLEKAGYRCVTQVPCGEPTGFTGQCTKQPEVGGAWPCITAIPHCAEPTGFTGQCTHQPWPNPTRYIGCTIFHCPTQDLTHIPHICNIVATGMPGCAVVDPRGGGTDPAAKVGAAGEGGKEGGGPEARPAAPTTSIPGCGYTQTWGLCETHLLGCGYTKQWGQHCPTQLPGCGETRDCPTTLPGCGWSKNPICTDLPGCGWTQQWGLCQQTQPPKCNVSVDIPCITQDLACGVTRNPACLANLGGGGFAAFRAAAPGPGFPIDTQLPSCNVSAAGACPSAVDACPTQKGCQTQPPTALCTQLAEACPTNFPDLCPRTRVPEACPKTSCGPLCQTQQADCTLMSPPCTQAGPQCPTYPSGDCTFFGCPPTPATVCTQSGPQCPSQFGSGCPTDMKFDCTFGCTQLGPGCPTINLQCPTNVAQNCNPNLAAARAQAFGVAGPGGAGAVFPVPLLSPGIECQTLGCPPQSGRPEVFCTGFGPCQLEVGTAFGQQCQTLGCPPLTYPVFVCTIVAPMGGVWDPAVRQAGGAPAGAGGAHITPLTVPVWQCQLPTPATHCFICYPHQRSLLPWLCPAPSPWCPPSPFCPITQMFLCGGGGPSVVDACPTRLCGGGA